MFMDSHDRHLLVVPAADVIAKEEHRDKSVNHDMQYFVFATDVWDGTATVKLLGDQDQVITVFQDQDLAISAGGFVFKNCRNGGPTILLSQGSRL